MLSWCRDEETFYRWTAGVLGDYPLTSERFAKTGSLMRITALHIDSPAGFFTLRNPDGRLNELRFGFVIVSPELRGKGIGRRMITEGLKYVFDNYRAARATISVFETNTPAYKCYLSAGFRETGVKETYTVNGETLTAVEMEYQKPMSE